MSFTIFYNEKTPFYALKPRSSNIRKIDIFSRGLTHDFGPKLAIFPTFFFRQYRPGKYLLRYTRTKKHLSRLSKQAVLKTKNGHFFKRVNPCFWSKNDHFSNFFFLGNIGQENVFYDILERKNAFLGYKNKKFKKSKNWDSSEGVNPGFWSKNGYFSNFLFRQYRPGKCLLRYSTTKKRLSRL